MVYDQDLSSRRSSLSTNLKSSQAPLICRSNPASQRLTAPQRHSCFTAPLPLSPCRTGLFVEHNDSHCTSTPAASDCGPPTLHLREVERGGGRVVQQALLELSVVVGLRLRVQRQVSVRPQLRPLDRQQLPHLPTTPSPASPTGTRCRSACRMYRITCCLAQPATPSAPCPLHTNPPTITGSRPVSDPLLSLSVLIAQCTLSQRHPSPLQISQRRALGLPAVLCCTCGCETLAYAFTCLFTCTCPSQTSQSLSDSHIYKIDNIFGADSSDFVWLISIIPPCCC
jgi:hypothetical protein